MITVAKSTINEAGDGVFALVDIIADTVICEYAGTVLKTTDDKSDKSRSYAMLNGMTIIAGGIGGYINDNVEFRRLTFAETAAFFQKKQLPRGSAHNCQYVELDGKVFVKSLRGISAGEELFTDYGFNFWATRFLMKGLIDRTYPITKFTF